LHRRHYGTRLNGYRGRKTVTAVETIAAIATVVGVIAIGSLIALNDGRINDRAVRVRVAVVVSIPVVVVAVSIPIPVPVAVGLLKIVVIGAALVTIAVGRRSMILGLIILPRVIALVRPIVSDLFLLAAKFFQHQVLSSAAELRTGHWGVSD